MKSAKSTNLGSRTLVLEHGNLRLHRLALAHESSSVLRLVISSLQLCVAWGALVSIAERRKMSATHPSRALQPRCGCSTRAPSHAPSVLSAAPSRAAVPELFAGGVGGSAEVLGRARNRNSAPNRSFTSFEIGVYPSGLRMWLTNSSFAFDSR